MRNKPHSGYSLQECECGLSYVRGSEEDEKSHAKIHAEYARGPKIAALGHLPSLSAVGELTFHAIDSSIPFEIRRKLAHVAMVAHRSIRAPSGYDGTVTKEDDNRLYILARNSHAVAMAVTALDSYFWKLAWGPDGQSIEAVERKALLRIGPKVARVWVAANYRRKGLATSLIIKASEHLGVDPQTLGWELPFTESGSAVVRKFSPAAFLGCCDAFTLSHQVLAASSAQKNPTQSS